VREKERLHIFLRSKILYLLLSIIIGLLFAANQARGNPHSEADLLLKAADDCRHALLRSKAEQKYPQHWLGCINRYEKVFTTYPKSEEAAWALYQCAGLYRGFSRHSGQLEDLEQAIRLYRHLADGHVAHRLADDAQYELGEIYYTRGDYRQAYVEFLRVGYKFPSGDMNPRAKERSEELVVLLSQGEIKETGENNSAAKTALVSVTGIRHWSNPTYTRIVVDTEGPVKYDHHLLRPDPDLRKPRRLYVDLQDARVSSHIKDNVSIGDGLLQRVRAGQYTPETVRVVLDCGSIGGYKVFHLFDPFRIVLDVNRETREEVAPQSSKVQLTRKDIRNATNSSISLARQLGLGVRKVVIDPGHGGKDPGCMFNGLKEKDITLKIAQALAIRLEEQLGCEVSLTRTRDIFLSLEERTAIANTEKADLFISLHVNALRDKRVRGIETYFLNVAASESAVMVAARENATSEKNISDLQGILSELMMNTKVNESRSFANHVQGELIRSVSSRYKGVKSLGVKQAPFYVLIGAEMPSILVESGFLTNTTERKRLASMNYQGQLARGIAEGIESYVRSMGLMAMTSK